MTDSVDDTEPVRPPGPDGPAGPHEPTEAAEAAEGADPSGDLQVPPGPPLDRDAPLRRGFLFTIGALAALVVGLTVSEASDALVLVLVAAFLAVGLEPVVGYVGRRGVPRRWAVLGLGLGLVAVLGGAAYVLGTVLVDQVSSLIENGPRLIDELRRNRTVADFDKRFHVLSSLEKKLTDGELTQDAVGNAFGFGLGVVNAVVNVVVVYVLMIYFVAARPQITRALYSLAPASRRPRVAELGDEILRRVGRYATGAVFVALIAGTVTAIFCAIVGLGEYALPLAVLVALLDLVPLVGAVLGAATVCLVGLATSLPIGITCIVFYLVYEVIEGYVLYPRVMRSSVDVPEYVTIVAVLVGGTVGGVVGALLALPVAAAALLLVREVWVRRQDTA